MRQRVGEGSGQTTIASQPSEVMAVIADFAAYPAWAGPVKVCEVLSEHRDGTPHHVRFVIVGAAVRDDYTLAYRWSEDRLGTAWQLVRSDLQATRTGSYSLRPVAGQTQVTFAFQRTLLQPISPVLQRQSDRAIMDMGLLGLKTAVERRG